MQGVIQNGLTEKQAEVHRFMADHMREFGMPPTIREIGDALGIRSPNGVMCHLRALTKKGWVRWTGGISRGRVPVDPTKPKACPCCGHVPTEADE